MHHFQLPAPRTTAWLGSPLRHNVHQFPCMPQGPENNWGLLAHNHNAHSHHIKVMSRLPLELISTDQQSLYYFVPRCLTQRRIPIRVITDPNFFPSVYSILTQENPSIFFCRYLPFQRIQLCFSLL
jgi:hypothetical protein